MFPLSVLPGTDFRAKIRELGLCYDQSPPYLIHRTPSYSEEDIYVSFAEAENLFDISLFPEPYLDIAFRQKGVLEPENPDVRVRINGHSYIKTLVLNARRPLDGIMEAAGRLTSPYQILIGPGLDDSGYICKILEILTGENPHTPFEVIFLGQDLSPNIVRFLRAVNLFRPGYLDACNTYQYRGGGNRSVLFTFVTQRMDISFEGEMRRRVFWWENPFLPEVSDMEALSEFDGVLIDAPIADRETMEWQNRMAGRADELIWISFSDVALQKRWLELTAGDVFSRIFFHHGGHRDHRENS
ncbi:MAG: hypothetical protein COX19_04220 [Desulfobacterales bacterium CG23_combo_of_CG06-09_8_20_14_all_51_8]|nr:MAG: hypothetical protein COX19_04220 [Desulfobacterales bacterium CG23_combo_of_CG06-09_8_20_14_all_51_8]